MILCYQPNHFLSMSTASQLGSFPFFLLLSQPPKRREDLWGDSWKQQELLHQLPSDLLPPRCCRPSVLRIPPQGSPPVLPTRLGLSKWRALALCRGSAKKGLKGPFRGLTSLSCSLELLLCGRPSSCTVSSSLTFTERSANGLICTRGDKQRRDIFESCSYLANRNREHPRGTDLWLHLTRGMKSCSAPNCESLRRGLLFLKNGAAKD